ncbi:MAG: abortive infection family protein [Bacteroidales bacterium]|nr:abortive infection family protein [Bacteroidales bacterium]
MNKITEITRRSIFDYMEIEKIWWNGRLEEPNFLSRIFDLESLPTTDGRFENAAGDIWQHRINNPQDWPDDWIFYDDRFNLLNCDDYIFLQFLCEMVHPVVRPNKSEVSKLHQFINQVLSEDGYELVEKTKISGRPIYSGRQKLIGPESLHKKNSEISERLSAEYVSKQISLMESAIDNSPHVAIGIAKELIETCCKFILAERQKEFLDSWDLPKLIKETNKELQLTPSDIPDEKAASLTIKKILGSLTTVVHGICELRNDYGSGHGKTSNFHGLGSRHAKLAVGASSTLAVFLLETHEIK